MRFPNGKIYKKRCYALATIGHIAGLLEGLGFSDGNYQLVVNFPRRILSDHALTLLAAGLGQRATVCCEEK